MRILITLISILWGAIAYAQTPPAKAISNCVNTKFCRDCGDVKVALNPQKKILLIKRLESKIAKSDKDEFVIRVLVDAFGKGCVIGYTPIKDPLLARFVIAELNDFDGYSPAKTGGKVEPNTAIDFIIHIENKVVTATLVRDEEPPPPAD